MSLYQNRNVVKRCSPPSSCLHSRLWSHGSLRDKFHLGLLAKSSLMDAWGWIDLSAAVLCGAATFWAAGLPDISHEHPFFAELTIFLMLPDNLEWYASKRHDSSCCWYMKAIEIFDAQYMEPKTFCVFTSPGYRGSLTRYPSEGCLSLRSRDLRPWFLESQAFHLISKSQFLPQDITPNFSKNGTNIVSLLSFPAPIALSHLLPMPLFSYHQFYNLKIHQTKQFQTKPNSPLSPQLAPQPVAKNREKNKNCNIRS